MKGWFMEPDRKPLKTTFIVLLLTAFLINILLHIPSFSRTSFKGDENVYQVLAHTMEWDLPNYTTANNPSISKWGNTIYKQPVFHHGPLLPLVIKTGLIFKSPTNTALLFANFAMAFNLYSVQPEQASATLAKNRFAQNNLKQEHWKVFAIVLLIVSTLGLQHFCRLFATYGSTFPWDFMQQDATASWNQFIETRTRSKNFINLVLLVPLLLVLFLPQTWAAVRHGLLRKDWGAIFTLSSIYLLATLFVFSYSKLRFFAAATPLFYCCLPWVLAQSKTKRQPLYFYLITISLCLMMAAGYREVIVRPNEVFRIVPIIYELVPPLQKYW